MITGRRTLLISLFALCLLILFPWFGEAQDQAIHVLYIGNSLTSFNNMPRMVSSLAAASGQTLQYEVYAPGGRRLVEHAQDPVLLQKIKQRKWDVVVLQEQSQWPAFSPTEVSMYVFVSASQLSRTIRSANPEARIVFYNTMARRTGDPGNAHVSEELKTYAGMQRRINRSYLTMAQDNQATLAPVGQVWQRVRSQYSGIHLYADNIHPNVVGSYLTACVFYVTFFHKAPFGLPYPSPVGAQTAEVIHDVVYQTVFLSSQQWDWSR